LAGEFSRLNFKKKSKKVVHAKEGAASVLIKRRNSGRNRTHCFLPSHELPDEKQMHAWQLSYRNGQPTKFQHVLR
jgi:hypothetical protein